MGRQFFRNVDFSVTFPLKTRSRSRVLGRNSNSYLAGFVTYLRGPRKVVEDGGGWAVLLHQCHPNSAGSLVIARRTE